MTRGTVNKILFITLSNIGDVVLSLPMLDYLKDAFPHSKITVMVGPRPKDIFEKNPNIDKVIVYDKHSSLKNKMRLFMELKKHRFDMVIDLRNSFYGLFLPARYRNAPFLVMPEVIKHMKYRNLYQMLKVGLSRRWLPDFTLGKMLHHSKDDQGYIDQALKEAGISQQDKIVIFSSGARSDIKRWPKSNFAELAASLKDDPAVKIVLVGDKDDIPVSSYIADRLDNQVLDLTGKTSLHQLVYLLKISSLVITNDSAVAHFASYLNVPVLSIFGPTNELKYGPWSKVYSVVTKGVFCRPCQKAQCRFGTLECMKRIKVSDVLSQANFLLNNRRRISEPIMDLPIKRILVSRTDRIGDVLLSTPAIKALREAYPNAYISVVVSPYAKDVVHGNPHVDEVLVYDKDKKHKGWFSSWRFSRALKKKDFDLAVILHPTNRMHIVTFFAAIKQRVGYDRKLGFLLTKRVAHTKHLGEKHELDYSLDLLRPIGILPKDRALHMPLKQESEIWADAVLRKNGIKQHDKILAINPGASCPSKVWPADRFAHVADVLADKHNFKIVVLSGPKDVKLADEFMSYIKHPVVNLAGKTSVSQLASVLKRSRLFISNDSGPVHIASALDIPVISIFGRSQKGLSPKRWGPVGAKNKVLHKDIGCVECLAHNCIKEFACLKAITIDEVVDAAEEILGIK